MRKRDHASVTGRGSRRGRVHGKITSGHRSSDEERGRGAAGGIRRRSQGAKEDSAVRNREAFQVENTADADG